MGLCRWLCVYAVVFWKPAGLVPIEWANFAFAVNEQLVFLPFVFNFLLFFFLVFFLPCAIAKR